MQTWVEVVPALPQQEANQKLDEWKASRRSEGKVIDEELIRRDQVLAKDKSQLVRYCILEDVAD